MLRAAVLLLAAAGASLTTLARAGVRGRRPCSQSRWRGPCARVGTGTRGPLKEEFLIGIPTTTVVVPLARGTVRTTEAIANRYSFFRSTSAYRYATVLYGTSTQVYSYW